MLQGKLLCREAASLRKSTALPARMLAGRLPSGSNELCTRHPPPHASPRGGTGESFLVCGFFVHLQSRKRDSLSPEGPARHRVMFRVLNMPGSAEVSGLLLAHLQPVPLCPLLILPAPQNLLSPVCHVKPHAWRSRTVLQ